MKQYVCNYSIARFLPYTETEEFVCVGVALLCPETRYFGYKLEMRKRDRVTGFFPELDPEVFIKGRRHFELQLQHVHRVLMADTNPSQLKLNLNPMDPVQVFNELVRPRESLFRFGGWQHCWPPTQRRRWNGCSGTMSTDNLPTKTNIRKPSWCADYNAS